MLQSEPSTLSEEEHLKSAAIVSNVIDQSKDWLKKSTAFKYHHNHQKLKYQHIREN